jgi:hypothetical protein
MKMFAINLIEKEQGFEVELPTIKQIYSKIHKIKHKTYDASNKRWYILPESLLEFIITSMDWVWSERITRTTKMSQTIKLNLVNLFNIVFFTFFFCISLKFVVVLNCYY